MNLAENIIKFEDNYHDILREREKKRIEFKNSLLEQIEQKKLKDEDAKKKQMKIEQIEEKRILRQKELEQSRIKRNKKKNQNKDTLDAVAENYRQIMKENNLLQVNKENNHNLILNTKISQKYIDSSKEDRKKEDIKQKQGISAYDPYFPQQRMSIIHTHAVDNNQAYNPYKNQPYLKERENGYQRRIFMQNYKLNPDKFQNVDIIKKDNQFKNLLQTNNFGFKNKIKGCFKYVNK